MYANCFVYHCCWRRGEGGWIVDAPASLTVVLLCLLLVRVHVTHVRTYVCVTSFIMPIIIQTYYYISPRIASLPHSTKDTEVSHEVKSQTHTHTINQQWQIDVSWPGGSASSLWGTIRRKLLPFPRLRQPLFLRTAISLPPSLPPHWLPCSPGSCFLFCFLLSLCV